MPLNYESLPSPHQNGQDCFAGTVYRLTPVQTTPKHFPQLNSEIGGFIRLWDPQVRLFTLLRLRESLQSETPPHERLPYISRYRQEL